MTWFKIDDGFHCHPKVLEAGNEGAGLYVRCGSYCAQHLTDGFVPAGVVLLYGNARLAQRLVTARLWSPIEGGWQMHDYLTYNPSRKQVEAEREAAAERQRKARERRAAERTEQERAGQGHLAGDRRTAAPPDSHAVSHSVSHAVTPPSRDGARHGVTSSELRRESHDPDPTRPDPTRSTSRTDIESGGYSSVADTAQTITTPPDGGRPRATRIPGDFTITDPMTTWANEHAPHVDIYFETEQFHDYWNAKSGRDATKLDWVATWRTWIRKAEQQTGRQPARNGHSRPSTADRAVADVFALGERIKQRALNPGETA